MDAETTLQDGTLLIYTQDDGGRITDTGVYLQPGAEHVVQVGKDLNRELAEAFVTRGICAVYTPECTSTPECTPEAVHTPVQTSQDVHPEAAVLTLDTPAVITASPEANDTVEVKDTTEAKDATEAVSH